MTGPFGQTDCPCGSRAHAHHVVPVPKYTAALTLPSRVDSVRAAVAFLVDTARRLNVPAASTTLFEVAIAEAVANAVRHGHSGAESATIRCEIEHDERQLTLRIIDGGPGFTVPEPQLPEIITEQVETLPEAGYGLPIIQSAFPIVRAVRVNGRFGLEFGLPLPAQPYPAK